MNITLSIVKDDKINVSKTLNSQKTISATLKANTSIVNPTFHVSKNAFNMIYNYIHVPEYNRYYFIKDVIFSEGGIVELLCHVDVLMSFRNQLLSRKALLKRQKREANLYFNDSEFYALSKETVNTVKFPQSLDKNGSLVLIVQGGN